MKYFIWLLVLAWFPALAFQTETPHAEIPSEPTWAFPVTSKNPPRSAPKTEVRHVPGSPNTYTIAQIDDLSNPPDWFPSEHPPAPKIVTHGDGSKVFACGACHLMSGLGQPQSANLAGLPVGYIETQLDYFKSGDRKDPFRMTDIGKALSDEDKRLASEWFASLKRRVWVKVVETRTVPKTYVKHPHMRLPLPNGGMEPIGNRIIELPEDPALAVDRDPKSGWVAYVPLGSVARGEALVKTGGRMKTVPCAGCHGPSLKGVADFPPLAGISPEYLARQLYRFQDGTRNGRADALMKSVVAHLKAQQIVDICAYLASQAP